MVDFTLNDQQQEWQQKARDFGDNELRPFARERDSNPDPEQAFDEALFRTGFAAGWQKTCIPTALGGLGLDCLTHTLIWEELGAAEAGYAVSMQAQAWAITMLLNMGTAEQCEEYIKPIVDGGLGVISAVEPETGAATPMYDPMNFAFKTTAKRDGDDWIINGFKTFAANAGTSLTRWIYLLARTDEDQAGMAGHSFFLIEPDNPGLKVGKNMDKMGHRSAYTPTLTLENCRVPAAALVGGKTGMPQPPARRQSTADSFLVVGAIGVGIARALYEEALKFAQQRNTAGKPMTQHQMIAARLGKMHITIEAARALLWKAAWYTDNHPQSDNKLSLAAKIACTDAAATISRDALQMFGAYGYTKEAIIEKLYRDAKAPEWYEGANESLLIALGQYVDWGV